MWAFFVEGELILVQSILFTICGVIWSGWESHKPDKAELGVGLGRGSSGLVR